MYYPNWRYMNGSNSPYYMSKPVNKSNQVNISPARNCDYFNLGDAAPDFTLQGVVGGKPEDITLSDLKGKWMVLFFYGSNFTFV